MGVQWFWKRCLIERWSKWWSERIFADISSESWEIGYWFMFAVKACKWETRGFACVHVTNAFAQEAHHFYPLCKRWKPTHGLLCQLHSSSRGCRDCAQQSQKSPQRRRNRCPDTWWSQCCVWVERWVECMGRMMELELGWLLNLHILYMYTVSHIITLALIASNASKAMKAIYLSSAEPLMGCTISSGIHQWDIPAFENYTQQWIPVISRV